jgi:hypothetical protein
MHRRDVYKISVGNSEGKRPRGLGVDRRILKWILQEDMDYIILTQKKWLTLAKTVKKNPDSIQGGEFLDHLSNHQFPTQDVKTTTGLMVPY